MAGRFKDIVAATFGQSGDEVWHLHGVRESSGERGKAAQSSRTILVRGSATGEGNLEERNDLDFFYL